MRTCRHHGRRAAEDHEPLRIARALFVECDCCGCEGHSGLLNCSLLPGHISAIRPGTFLACGARAPWVYSPVLGTRRWASFNGRGAALASGRPAPRFCFTGEPSCTVTVANVRWRLSGCGAPSAVTPASCGTRSWPRSRSPTSCSSSWSSSWPADSRQNSVGGRALEDSPFCIFTFDTTLRPKGRAAAALRRRADFFPLWPARRH